MQRVQPRSPPELAILRSAEPPDSRGVIVPVSEGRRANEYLICFLTHQRVTAREQDDNPASEDRR